MLLLIPSNFHPPRPPALPIHTSFLQLPRNNARYHGGLSPARTLPQGDHSLRADGKGCLRHCLSSPQRTSSCHSYCCRWRRAPNVASLMIYRVGLLVCRAKHAMRPFVFVASQNKWCHSDCNRKIYEVCNGHIRQLCVHIYVLDRMQCFDGHLPTLFRRVGGFWPSRSCARYFS